MKRYDIRTVTNEKMTKWVFEHKEYLKIVENFVKKHNIELKEGNYIIGFQYINKKIWQLFLEID